MASQDNKKKKINPKRIISSIKNSNNGLIAAYTNEQSLYIHLIASIILLLFSIIFKISRTEWLFIIFIIGSTLTIELVNTAIENVVDLVTKEYAPLAKSAKDIASAAEYILAITSFLIFLIIFTPKFMVLI